MNDYDDNTEKENKERKILILPGSAGDPTGMKVLRAVELTPVPYVVRKGTKLQSRTLNLGHTVRHLSLPLPMLFFNVFFGGLVQVPVQH